jgi:hypothetical protein
MCSDRANGKTNQPVDATERQTEEVMGDHLHIRMNLDAPYHIIAKKGALNDKTC